MNRLVTVLCWIVGFLFAVAAVVSLFGCGTYEEWQRDRDLEAKIVDWQERERASATIPSSFAQLSSADLARRMEIARRLTIDSIFPTSERSDYWKTSEETSKDGKGDCEDFCALALVALGQLEVEGWCSIVQLRKDSLHTIVTAYGPDGWMAFDNTAALSGVVVGREGLLPALPLATTFIAQYNARTFRFGIEL